MAQASSLAQELVTHIQSLQTGAGHPVTIETVSDLLEKIGLPHGESTHTHDQEVRDGIRAMVGVLDSAKSEIAGFFSTTQRHGDIADMSAHLDAVVQTTEDAANTILDAAIDIQNAMTQDASDAIDTVMEATNRIVEACNFQDLSGQRLRKVMKVLLQLEVHTQKLATLFRDDVKPAPSNGSRPLTDEELMNGPQLLSETPSQDDIDALFSSL
jgi:chemotaxis protein CheZ